MSCAGWWASREWANHHWIHLLSRALSEPCLQRGGSQTPQPAAVWGSSARRDGPHYGNNASQYNLSPPVWWCQIKQQRQEFRNNHICSSQLTNIIHYFKKYTKQSIQMIRNLTQHYKKNKCIKYWYKLKLFHYVKGKRAWRVWSVSISESLVIKTDIFQEQNNLILTNAWSEMHLWHSVQHIIVKWEAVFLKELEQSYESLVLLKA